MTCNFLRGLLYAVCIVLITFDGAAQVAAQKQPNIIFILADDLGYTDLGCYGNAYIKTPNIDRLCASGMKFTQFYVANPVCSPSRAAFLTGKYPSRLPITNYMEGRRGDTSSNLLPAAFLESLPRTEYTLAKALKKQGYKTAIIGKWHLGSADTAQPFVHGFDYERVANNRVFYYDFTLLSHNKVVYTAKENENLTDRLTEEAISFIEQNKKTPFFLYLAHFAPHLVMQPKPQKLPNYYFTYNKLSHGKYDPQYAATIETLDDNIGVLLKKLDTFGLLQNTIIVFTSDNGGVANLELGVKPTDNTPLRAGKGYVYEGGIRIPMIISWKGTIEPGSYSGQSFMNIDFFPTLMQLAGDPHQIKSIDGTSFKTVLEGKKDTSERIFFWHYPHFSNQGGRPAAAIRKGDYKLIEFYETGKLELYNLINDLSEKEDISGKMPEKVKELKFLLDSWRTETKANMPTRNVR